MDLEKAAGVTVRTICSITRAEQYTDTTLMRPASNFDRLFLSFGRGPKQCFADGGAWNAEAGDLVYISRALSYADVYPHETDGYSIVLALDADYAGEDRFRLPFGDNAKIRALFSGMLAEYERRRPGWYYGCMHMLYEVLSMALKRALAGYTPSGAAKKIAPAVELMTANFRDPEFGVADAAAACSVSYSHFRKLFSDVFGMSAKSYLGKLRTDNACRLLSSPDLSVAEVAAMSGFGDEYYFSAAFKRATGKSPTAYRRKN